MASCVAGGFAGGFAKRQGWGIQPYQARRIAQRMNSISAILSPETNSLTDSPIFTECRSTGRAPIIRRGGKMVKRR